MLASMRRALAMATIAATLAGVAACGSDTPEDPGFAGHWNSTQWGDAYIQVDGATVKVVYTHDNGRVLATLDGATITGWWTETPSRTPPRDAGTVTWTLLADEEPRTLDGVWSYGADGAARENWDLTWVGSEVPDDVLAAFDEDDAFTPAP